MLWCCITVVVTPAAAPDTELHGRLNLPPLDTTHVFGVCLGYYFIVATDPLDFIIIKQIDPEKKVVLCFRVPWNTHRQMSCLWTSWLPFCHVRKLRYYCTHMLMIFSFRPHLICRHCHRKGLRDNIYKYIYAEYVTAPWHRLLRYWRKTRIEGE